MRPKPGFAGMWIALECGPALVFGGKHGEEFDLLFIERVAGGLGAASVASLNELQDHNGSFGGNRGELEQPIGRFDPAVFELETLSFDQAKQLFDNPALFVPIDDLPGGRDIAHVMSRQQVPMQRLDACWRIDFSDLDQSKLDCLG